MSRTKTTLKTVAKEISETSEKVIRKTKPILTEDLVPSGVTLLNCSCSDNPFGAWKLGTMVRLIGDTSSGKTFLVLTSLAECCSLKRLKDYRLFYDDVEARNNFDISYLFGDRLAKRLEAPLSDDDGPRGSNTIEEFKKTIFNLIKKKEKFIYVLDCFDALTSEAELAKMNERKTPGTKPKGSFKTEKTRGLSEMLRMVIRGLERTGSLLIIISQVRENMDRRFAFSPKFVTTGGRALFHYASTEIWLSQVEKIRKEAGKRKRIIGVLSQAKVTKGSLTGKIRDCEFPIYYDYGIDDIGSSVEFMTYEEFWTKDGKEWQALTGVKGTKKSIITQIEDKGLFKTLKKAVGQAWNVIEESLRLNRKRKF